MLGSKIEFLGAFNGRKHRNRVGSYLKNTRLFKYRTSTIFWWGATYILIIRKQFKIIVWKCGNI